MARIDYAISLSAIQSTTHEGVNVENLDAEIGKSLGGGNSSTTWAGSAIATPNWTASDGCIHYASGDSNNTFAVDSGADGLWIKHTGFNFDAGVTPSRLGTTANTALVTVEGANDVICKLKAGEAIFLPQPKNQTITFTDNGTAAAMEVVVLT